ncbi:MAG TPA: carboxypeptidase regulatory-like domain-containing protein, partial [Armatimonadota bacterium]
MMNLRLSVGTAMVAACLLFGTPAFAAGPQSDDWSAGKAQAFWTFESVGDVGGIADNVYDKDKKTYTSTSGGADTWGTGADAFNYLYQKVTGDFAVTVTVQSGMVAPADTYAKAGLMIRSTTDPGAAYYYAFESPFRTGLLIESRTDDGGATALSENPVTDVLPLTIRVVRSGGFMSTYVSRDGGKTFIAVGTPQAVASYPGLNVSEVLVGIATCAHNTDPAKPVVVTYGPVSAAALDATVTGTLADSTGKGVAGKKVMVTGGDMPFSAITDADGKFTVNTSPGSYQVSGNGPGIETDTQPATTTSGKSVDVKLTATLLPTLSLATADGAKWKILALQADADAPQAATDYAPAAPTFNDSTWESVDVPSEVNGGNPVVDNSHFWYRTTFKMPAGFAALKDRAFI